MFDRSGVGEIELSMLLLDHICAVTPVVFVLK